ncbi:malonate decarboxylase holo-[acyl-carrier-protein] synthase [Eubacteriales bacterium OttesenSCG-928-K08]|nr:malonate decarboxylase holo-[acyl-carrier-protein] synthase [Eubacteriales bacterium OttesenSCG-928-K08]
MLARHDFIFFNRMALSSIINSANCVLNDAPREYIDELFEHAGTRIPGIVRRQESACGELIDIGLSSPRLVNGTRLRVGATIPKKYVLERVTPFEAMDIALAAGGDGRALKTLDVCARMNALPIGLVGSRALKAVSGLDYLSPASDYDLLIRGRLKQMEGFARLAAQLGQHLKIALDVEARVLIEKSGEACDVKLVELLSNSQFVLGKTLREVLLLERAQLYMDV